MNIASSLKKGKWLSVLIAVLSFWFIAYRLFQYGHQFSSSDFPPLNTPEFIFALIVQFFLLCINILFEAKKWQSLLSNIQKTRLGQSLKMVLAGFTSGIITPGKLGEPVGRLLFLPKHLWPQAALLTYLGGIISNLLVFAVALACLPATYGLSWLKTSDINPLYLVLFLAMVPLGLLLWFNRKWIKKHLHRFKLLHKLKQLLDPITSTPKKTIAQIIFYSFLRFSVYCLQLAIMLYIMGGHITSQSIVLIPIYYMLISIVPSFFLAELGIRGSVALIVFSTIQLSDLSIVAAVWALWILNQAFPAIMGIVILWQKKNIKNNNN